MLEISVQRYKNNSTKGETKMNEELRKFCEEIGVEIEELFPDVYGTTDVHIKVLEIVSKMLTDELENCTDEKDKVCTVFADLCTIIRKVCKPIKMEPREMVKSILENPFL